MMPKKNDPLTLKEVTEAAEIFMPLFDAVYSRMPEGTRVEDCLKVMEAVAKLGHKKRADDAEEEKNLKFGFNKKTEDDNDSN